MRDLLTQIEGAVAANSYYLALYAGLTIPDICGAMESEDGQANKAKYVAWFDKYVGGNYVVRGNQTLTGEVCYFYRCSVLHQGRAQHPRMGFSRIIFVEPGATTNVFHNNVLMDALNIDASIFCRQLVEGARTWLDEQEKSANYAKNFAQFMQRYPTGLAPTSSAFQWLLSAPWNLTPPSSGRTPARFACFRPPLMSNVGRRQTLPRVGAGCRLWEAELSNATRNEASHARFLGFRFRAGVRSILLVCDGGGCAD